MERLVKGDIVTLNFPFTDLSGFKKRPALVVATLRGDDVILCQITTKEKRADEYSIELSNSDFLMGKLPRDDCLIRTNCLFTGDKELILAKKGTISKEKLEEARQKLKEIVSN